MLIFINGKTQEIIIECEIIKAVCLEDSTKNTTKTDLFFPA